MKNTEELSYIGTLKNGTKVFDKVNDSNWQNSHKVVTKELLVEALEKIDAQGETFVGAVDMGRVIGKSFCVPITNFDQIYMARRNGKDGETPTVLNKMPIDSSKLTVILSKNNDGYILNTTYVGDVIPMEPWDSNLINSGNEKEIEEAKEFWNTHALVYDRSAVEYFVLDGNQIDKKDFESQYIYNKNIHTFDVPANSLTLMMGVPEKEKIKKEQYMAQSLDGEVISSESIREEYASDGKVEDLYSEDTKKQIYDEMIERVEKNVKSGKFTIADATFLFENGEYARKKLYQCAENYDVPLRVVIMKLSLQDVKKLKPNADKTKLESMWNYMNSTYDQIEQELKSMKNTKVQVVGGAEETVY